MQRRWGLELAVVLIAVALGIRCLRTAPTNDPVSTPTPVPGRNARACYDLCAHRMQVAVAALQAEYGPGPLPMGAVQQLSMDNPCPATGQPTWSASGGQDGFYLFCRGRNHVEAGFPEDYPDCHSERGLNRGFRAQGPP